jgi:hypothetical protein
MNPEKYKPKVKGKSDFYSWQLYKWMKKNPDFCRIFEGVWNSATGYEPHRKVLYIGLLDDECFMGNLLVRICTYKAKLESYAYCSKAHHLEEWKDITEEFFMDYEKRGVCAIHKGIVHKWAYQPDSDIRTCAYCGETQKKELVTVQKEVWR